MTIPVMIYGVVMALLVVACQTSPPQGEDIVGTAAGFTATEMTAL